MTETAASASRPSAASDVAPTVRRPGPVGPLYVAGYVTWLAVALIPVQQALAGRADLLGGVGAVGFAALLTQLLAFVVVGHLSRIQRYKGLARGLVVLQAIATLVAFAALPSGSVPVLLILVAAQLVPLFPVPVALGLMIASNGVLAWLMTTHASFASALPDLLAYAGFEVFAALTASYALRAEDARDAIARVNAELVATRQLLVESARGEERLRLSRELHDVAGHRLTALKLQLRALAATSPDGRRAELDECAHLADQLLAEVRGVVAVLRVDDGIDLASSLAALVPSLPRPRVTVDVDPDVRVPGLEAAQTLLRCAQEGLTNALRHADAAHVRISLVGDDDALTMRVEDDGRGDAMPRYGNGLFGMSERLAALGGSLDVATVAGGGMRLTATLPAVVPA